MDNHLGKVIETNRKNRNWTRQYLADRLGVNVSMISFYERGIKIPSDKKKLVLCELFNISWNELVGESPETTLKLTLTNLLFDMNLNQNELQFVLQKVENFYCNKNSYKDFKDFHVDISWIDTAKVEDTICKIESLFFKFFAQEVYKTKEQTVISMSEISKYIQENFANTLREIICNLNENDILHDSFITIYRENEEQNSSLDSDTPLSNTSIVGYTTYPKEYLEKGIQLFGLLIENQSHKSRYQNSDVVIFKKIDKLIYDQDLLVFINGKLEIVTIRELGKDTESILIYREDEQFDILSKEKRKDQNLQVIGLPIEIKINYFNRNNDI